MKKTKEQKQAEKNLKKIEKMALRAQKVSGRA